MYWYVPVHTGMYWNKATHTSGAWHRDKVMSVLPHTTISRTLCKILWAFSKFHLDFSTVLSGSFCWRISSMSTAFWCNSGSSDSRIRDWQDAIFQSMHLMRTSTTSLLGSATWGKPHRCDQALALSIALLMRSTLYIAVRTSYIALHTSTYRYILGYN